MLENNQAIALIRGKARFTGAHTLAVKLAAGGELEIGFDKALIATGASPTIPPMPGLEGTPYWIGRGGCKFGYSRPVDRDRLVCGRGRTGSGIRAIGKQGDHSRASHAVLP